MEKVGTTGQTVSMSSLKSKDTSSSSKNIGNLSNADYDMKDYLVSCKNYNGKQASVCDKVASCTTEEYISTRCKVDEYRCHEAKLLLDEYKCPICMDVYVKTSVISCGHRFCFSCIKQWFHHSFPRRFCPVCRKNCIYLQDDSAIDGIVSDLYSCLSTDEKEERKTVMIDREYPSIPPFQRPAENQNQQMYFDGFMNELSQWSPMTESVFPTFHPVPTNSTPTDLIYGRDGWPQPQSLINHHPGDYGNSFRSQSSLFPYSDSVRVHWNSSSNNNNNVQQQDNGWHLMNSHQNHHQHGHNNNVWTTTSHLQQPTSTSSYGSKINSNTTTNNNNFTMNTNSTTANTNFTMNHDYSVTKTNSNNNNNKTIKNSTNIPKSHEDYQQDVLIQQEFQRLDELLLRDDDDDLNISEDESGPTFPPISNQQQNLLRFNGGGTSGQRHYGNNSNSVPGNGGSSVLMDTQSEPSTRSSTPPGSQKLSSSMMGVSHGDGIWGTCPEMSARMYLPNGILLFKLEYQPSSVVPTSSSSSLSSSSSHGPVGGGTTSSSTSNHLAKFSHPNIHILPSNDSTRVNVAFDVIYQSH